MERMIDVARAVGSGLRPVVTFKDGIAEKESYPEAGMRARLLSVSNQSDGILKIKFSYAEFDEFNKQFESANYYGQDQLPNKTARETGYYHVEEAIYFDGDELSSRFFDIENNERVALHDEFRAAAPSVNYVQWLEDQLLAARAA